MKWQPICRTVYNFSRSFSIIAKSLQDYMLRFNPIQIAEWLDDLLVRRASGNKAELSRLA